MSIGTSLRHRDDYKNILKLASIALDLEVEILALLKDSKKKTHTHTPNH